ncbi:MAG: TIGR02281 family clan AA aspartic protease [Hyphomicrobiaceae bacterium]|nr:TIGR02281 family clan AA aspartic protease [Hyphomicrobiaceae bacterium]
MLSSGTKNLLQLLGGWILTLALVALTIVNFDEIRSTLGLKLGPADFGVTADERMPEARPRAVEERVERPREDDRDAPRPPPQARRRASHGSSVELQRSPDGHFHADAYVNGQSIPVLIDTGATLVALSYDDAIAAGIAVSDGDFIHWSNTANGKARFASVMLDDVRIGDVVVRNVRAAVSEPGRLTKTLLGMSFLGQTRMQMQGASLVLER